jgi:hypothetical protein
LAEIGAPLKLAAQTGVKADIGGINCSTPPFVLAVHLLLLVSGQLAQHSSGPQSVLDWHLLLIGLSVS